MSSRRFRPTPRALSVAIACQLCIGNADAITYNFSDGKGKFSFDTTVSAGVLVRAQNPDPRLIGIANGGTSRSVNEDDGNLNYERGEIVSAVAKTTHDLELAYGKTGMFLRFGYFHDFAAARKDFSQFSAVDQSFITHKRLDADGQLFDAYVRHEFEIDGRRTNIRLGKQVVSWGESTLIQGGINSINPVDLTRLRAPGAELKEAFIPVTMLWGSQQLSENVTLEGFNQFYFEPFRIDPFSSFFSSTDVFSPGGRESFTGFGRTPDSTHGGPNSQNPGQAPTDNSTIPRGPDQMPRNLGQFGAALRIFLPDLNNTEVGLYAMNYHSRIPLASTTMAGCLDPTGDLPLPPGGVCAPARRDASSARIFAEYPENIQLAGLSFNTPGPFGIALQGEYSFRPNLPLQIATAELVLATLGLPNSGGFGSGVPMDPNGGVKAPGEKLEGYRRVPAHQAQFTATKSVPNLFGAEQAIFLMEGAYVFLDLPEGIKFAGPATYLPAAQSRTLLGYPSPLVANGSVQPDGLGYMTRESFGYRLISRLEYADVFANINLFPRIVISHDVKGVSPFLTEDVKAVSLGLNATYNQVWSADISYTNFFGGRVFKGTDCQASLTGASATPALPEQAPAQLEAFFGQALGALNNQQLANLIGGGLCRIPEGPTSAFGQPTTFKSIANPSIDRDFIAASISYSF